MANLNDQVRYSKGKRRIQLCVGHTWRKKVALLRLIKNSVKGIVIVGTCKEKREYRLRSDVETVKSVENWEDLAMNREKW